MSNYNNTIVLPTAPPPYVEHPQGQNVPYGFTTNAGHPQPQGQYMQPGAPPPGYAAYQPGYPQPQHGYAQPEYAYPQPGYPISPPQPGYPISANSGYSVPSVTNPGQTEPVTMQPRGDATVVVVGGCPNCRTGALEDNYTCLGVCCAIFFFPIGILCCLAMKEKKCQNCNSTF